MINFFQIILLSIVLISCKSTSVNRRSSVEAIVEGGDPNSGKPSLYKSCTQLDADKLTMCMEIQDAFVEYCLGEMSEAPCDPKQYARQCTQVSSSDRGSETYVYFFKADSKTFCAGKELVFDKGAASSVPSVPSVPSVQPANPPIPQAMANQYCTVKLIRDVKDGGSQFKAMKDQTYFAAASSQALALVPLVHSYIDILLPDGTYTSNCDSSQLNGFSSESVALQDFDLYAEQGLTQKICTVKQATIFDDLTFSSVVSDTKIFLFNSASVSVPESCRGKDFYTKDSFIERLAKIAASAPATPPPASPPAKLPIRAVANASEIMNARTAYAGDCASCHGVLASSTKKGVSIVRLNNASSIAAHTTVNSVGKWPIDMKDTTDDGIDTAVLKASAMVEALK